MTDATLREVCGQKPEELLQNMVWNKVWKSIKFGKGLLKAESKTCLLSNHWEVKRYISSKNGNLGQKKEMYFLLYHTFIGKE